MEYAALSQIFDPGLKLMEIKDGNILFHGELDPTIKYGVVDVEDRFYRLAAGKAFHSRLAWGDTLRNTVVAMELEKMEPNVVVELGCGVAHPVGRMIAGMGLDTHYIGIDPSEKHVRTIMDENAELAFVGIVHDVNYGIPLLDSTADVAMIMEAWEHWTSGDLAKDNTFKEIRRVLNHYGTLFFAGINSPGVQQHPKSLSLQFSWDDIKRHIESAGFELVWACNYRARPANAPHTTKLESAYRHNLTGLPLELTYSMELMKNSRANGEIVAGNVLSKWRVKT